jgi:hypothetical protein
MPYGQILSDSITDSSGGVLAPSSSVFRNRIINGDMRIDQRNSGASVTNTALPIYSLDRWAINGAQASKFTAQQNAASVTPPVGFTNYLGTTSSSAYSVLTGDYFLVQQLIEGLNVSDLAWGTANAKTVTLSFWVRSSLTGTFGGSIRNSAGNRSYPFTYTISAANTWEQKSITIAGDTSGTWLTTNGIGLNISFSLGAGATYSGTAGAWVGSNIVQPTGSTSVVGTNGATFYITGVQLEKGSTATSFDYRPYGTELSLAQRYFWKISENDGNTFMWVGAVSTTSSGTMVFPLNMRVTPTVSFDGALFINDTTANALVNAATANASVLGGGVSVLFSSASSTLTAGRAARLYGIGTTTPSFVGLSSEL